MVLVGVKVGWVISLYLCNIWLNLFSFVLGDNFINSLVFLVRFILVVLVVLMLKEGIRIFL